MPCVLPLYIHEQRNITRETFCFQCAFYHVRAYAAINLETQGVSYQCEVHILEGKFSKISDTNNGGETCN
jgi:hypothetical protein